MHAQTLVKFFEKLLLEFDYQAKPMAMFPIQGSNLEIWREALFTQIKPDVQMAILLIPGNRGRSQLYHDLKRLMLEQIPVAS